MGEQGEFVNSPTLRKRIFLLQREKYGFFNIFQYFQY